MPVFSLGGMRYQESWDRGVPWTKPVQDNLEATFDRALSLGITHIETARGYGTSEAQLGPALDRLPRSAYLLQTKVRPHGNPKVFEAQLEESFASLKVNYLDLFAFHGLNDAAAVQLTLDRCLKIVERYRAEGRIRNIGFSTHAPPEVILGAVKSGRFDYVNLHYYYLFQDNAPVVQAAAAQDMGVFIISPSDKGGRLYKPSAKLRALCAPLSPMAFNDLWCLSHPEVNTLSIGAARPSDFDEHLKILPMLAEPEKVLAPIVERLEEAYRQALGTDFAKAWFQGLRNFDQIPGRVNVRKILWLRNLVLAYDLIEYAQERYMAMAPDDLWVPGARAENIDPEAIVAALPDSPFRGKIPALLREAHAMLFNPAVSPMP
jgi:predicted aldo/keto reductase-like oxidoreductase